MNRTFFVSAFSCLTVLLSGCGSNGSSDAPPGDSDSSAYDVEGIYDVDYGQFQGTYAFLDNGSFYGIHFVRGELAGHPRGDLPEDNSTTNKSPIAWANFVDYQQVGEQEPDAMFGRTGVTTDTVKVAIEGSFGEFTTTSGTQKQWNESEASTLYYDPIPMDILAGDYTGVLRTVGIEEPKQSVSNFSIDLSGNFYSEVNTCSYTGTATRYGNTGVMLLYATASGNECVMNTSLNGLLMPVYFVNDKPQIAVMLNSDDQEHTAVFLLQK